MSKYFLSLDKINKNLETMKISKAVRKMFMKGFMGKDGARVYFKRGESYGFMDGYPDMFFKGWCVKQPCFIFRLFKGNKKENV